MKKHIYSGAGNSFVVLDGISECIKLETTQIVALCREYHTDGLMVLERAQIPSNAFAMRYYNSDGSGGMMCGNGGRCIVAFAHRLGLFSDSCHFEAPDGVHEAQVLSGAPMDPVKTIRLGMRDVDGIDDHSALISKQLALDCQAFYLNTGTRHLVVFLPEDVDLQTWDVDTWGRKLRGLPAFAPEGVNVNFTKISDESIDGASCGAIDGAACGAACGEISVRTFEKGVEGETLACGTGVTAAALASRVVYGLEGRIAVHVQGGELAVDSQLVCSRPQDPHIQGSLTQEPRIKLPEATFRHIHLIGPAEILA